MLDIMEITIKDKILIVGRFDNGPLLCNVSGHYITFGNSKRIFGELPASGFLVESTPKAKKVSEFLGITLQTTEFYAKKETIKFLKILLKNNILPIGGVIASKTYPELVYGIVPVKGFERVPLNKKRVQINVFNVEIEKNKK